MGELCARKPDLSRVATAFPGHVFPPTIEFLQEHGTTFHLHRVKGRRFTDVHGYIEGVVIEVTSLHCVVGSFEVLMQHCIFLVAKKEVQFGPFLLDEALSAITSGTQC